MTVEELIDELRKYPPILNVVVRSYELGYDTIKSLEIMSLTPNPTDHNYEGNIITYQQREYLSEADSWGWEKTEHCETVVKNRFDGLVIVGDSPSPY